MLLTALIDGGDNGRRIGYDDDNGMPRNRRDDEDAVAYRLFLPRRVLPDRR